MKRRSLRSLAEMLIKRYRIPFRLLEGIFWFAFLLVAWEIWGPMFSHVFSISLLLGKITAAFLVIVANFGIEIARQT